MPTVKKIEDYSSAELFALANAKKAEEDKSFVTFKMFKCYNPKCRRTSRLDKWERVYNYYYEDCPYTPNWLYDGEMRLICPKCQFLNRIISRSHYDYNKHRTVYESHVLKTLVIEFVDKGGKLAAEYTCYGDDYYKLKEVGNIWDYHKRDKINIAPFIDWVNVPDKI